MMAHRTLGAAVEGAILGGLIALVLGLIWVTVAADNGFGDLVAAAVARVVLIPVGVVVGAAIGCRRRRSARI